MTSRMNSEPTKADEMKRLSIVWTRIDSLTNQMSDSESGRACECIAFLVSSSEDLRVGWGQARPEKVSSINTVVVARGGKSEPIKMSFPAETQDPSKRPGKIFDPPSQIKSPNASTPVAPQLQVPHDVVI